MIKISIVVPVYNPGAYLSPCLETMLAQTLQEWECLCIDDGSTDGSAAVLDRYATRDSRFRVFHRANAGAAAARNYALGLVQGEFVAFMDADDSYPDKTVLERLYNDAREHDALICGGGVEGVTESWGACISPPRFVKARDWPFDYGFWRYLYARSLFADGTVRFPTLTIYEDPVFLIRALGKAGGFYGVDYLTYRYRADYKRRDFKAHHYRLLKIYLKGLNLALAESQRLNLTAIYNHLCDYIHGGELADLAGHVHHRSFTVWFLYARLLRCHHVR